MKMNPLLSLHTKKKVNSHWIKDFNVSFDTLNLHLVSDCLQFQKVESMIIMEGPKQQSSRRGSRAVAESSQVEKTARGQGCY